MSPKFAQHASSHSQPGSAFNARAEQAVLADHGGDQYRVALFVVEKRVVTRSSPKLFLSVSLNAAQVLNVRT